MYCTSLAFSWSEFFLDDFLIDLISSYIFNSRLGFIKVNMQEQSKILTSASSWICNTLDFIKSIGVTAETPVHIYQPSSEPRLSNSSESAAAF